MIWHNNIRKSENLTCFYNTTKNHCQIMKIHLINGHEYWEHSQGRLNNSLVEVSLSFFREKGDSVTTSIVDSQYDIEIERELFINADMVLFFTPVFWMGIPSSFKRYLDNLLSGGRGIIYSNDGREEGGEYGSGGLMTSSYALITTWNAPEDAFNRKEAFLFEGKSVDDVFFNFHSAMKFIGMKKKTSLSLHDVMKNINFEKSISIFKQYLKTL